jgi:hypothetical protein
MNISHIAATAQASLLKPSLASGAVLFSLAFTAQNTARQHSDAETHTDIKSKTMILMNLARGMSACDRIDIKAER